MTTLPGFPTRHEVAERYAQRTGADLSDLNWYVGFAFFKFAAIIAGIVARSAAGAMAGKDTLGLRGAHRPVRRAGTRRTGRRCDLGPALRALNSGPTDPEPHVAGVSPRRGP